MPLFIGGAKWGEYLIQSNNHPKMAEILNFPFKEGLFCWSNQTGWVATHYVSV